MQAMLCMFTHGKALADFYLSRKVAMVGAHSAASWCFAVVTSWKYPCTPVWAGRTAEGLGSPASQNVSCVVCGVGKNAGWICVVGIIFECCHSDAEVLSLGSQGMGLDQQRACMSTLRLLVEPDVLVCFPSGKLDSLTPLCCRVPTIPYSHSMLLGWCCSGCRKFGYSLILNSTNLKALYSNDTRLLEKKQVG